MANTVNPMNYYQTVATNGNGKTDNGTVIKRDSNAMDQDAFVKILVSEMANQSPDNPADSTQFVAQMAQFSSVEQMTNLNRTMTFNSASNSIGKAVTLKDVDDAGNPIRGVVHKVARNGDNITVFVQLVDSDNKPVYQQKYDASGNAMKDKDGNPIYETTPQLDDKGNEVKDKDGKVQYVNVPKVVEFPYADISNINDGYDVKDTEAEEQKIIDDAKAKADAAATA